MKLNERIKDCRLRSGLTQEQVADALNVSRQAVTKWENGRSAPSTDNLFRLAELFDTSVDLILSDQNRVMNESEGPLTALLKNRNFWISFILGLVLFIIVGPYRQNMYIPLLFNFICVLLNSWTVTTISVLLYKMLSRQPVGEDWGMFCALLIFSGIGQAIFSMMFWGCWLCLGLTVLFFLWLLANKWKEIQKNKEKST